MKVVFFDAVGTLIYLPESVGVHYGKIARRHGVELSTATLDNEFRRAWKNAPARQNTVGPRPDDDKGWWRTLVREVLNQVLPTEKQRDFDHESYFEELYTHFASPGVWAAFPETESVVDSLQARGFTLGVISNFDRRLHQILEHLHLASYFKIVVVSSEVGADKPDPAIFQRGMTLLDVGPAEAVHVGDDPKRDGGAEAVGLEVFELNRPRRTLNDLTAWLDNLEARRTNLQPETF